MKTDPVHRMKENIEQLNEIFEQGKRCALDLTEAAASSSKEAAYSADEWARDNTWKLLAATLAFGLVFGLLFSRRSGEWEPRRIPR